MLTRWVDRTTAENLADDAIREFERVREGVVIDRLTGGNLTPVKVEDDCLDVIRHILWELGMADVLTAWDRAKAEVGKSNR